MYITLPFLVLAAYASALPSFHNVTRRITSAAPPEAKAVLRNVTSFGTGCAPNSAAFVIADNATLAFDSMIVDTSTAPVSRACSVSVNLSVDKGWKYVVNAQGAKIRGYADLPTGQNVDAQVTLKIDGKQLVEQQTFKGDDSANNWVWILPADGNTTSACGGGVLIIDSSLRVGLPKGRTGYFTVDTEDISFDFIKC